MKASFQTALLAGLLLLQLHAAAFRARGAAGDVDLSFDPGFGVNGPVNAVAVQPDGKVIIGGGFTTVKGLVRVHVARLNADGSGDSSFTAGAYGLPYGVVYALALQSDGKVLVGHQYGHARLNSDGSVDTNFSASVGVVTVDEDGDHFVPEPVYSVAVQPDGRVLIGGPFTTVNATNRNGIARLNSNGSLDGGFNPDTGTNGRVRSITLQSDGKALIGGAYHTVNGTNRRGIARLNADGSLDTGFAGTGIAAYLYGVSSIVVQSDGKVLIGGDFFFVNATNHGGIARLNADGSLDSSFNPGTGVRGVGYPYVSYPGVQSVGVQSDGKVLIGGHFSIVNGTSRNNIARFNADGSLDSSFNMGAGGYAYGVSSVVVQSDDKVLIGGSFSTVNGTNRSRIALLNADGGLDGSFHPGIALDRPVSSLVVQPDGKVLIGGPFTFINGTNRYGSAQLNADGSLDSTFISDSFNPDLTHLYGGSPSYAEVAAVAVQSDGKVLVGGFIALICTPDSGDGCQNLFASFVTRLNPNGSRDPGFTPIIGPYALSVVQMPQVQTVALQPDGKVVVGYVGYGDRGIVRLHTNGIRDTNFNTSVAYPGVYSVVPQADGKLLMGGSFNTVNGTNRNGLARLNSDGSLDGSFNPAVGGYPLALQPDGKLLVGGYARLNADGSLDSTFNPVTGGNGGVRSIALQPDGKVLIGGDFLTVNGVLRPYVTRLYGDSPASFAGWAAQFGLSGASAAANADPDFDGLPNGAEYVLGGNPTTPTHNVRPTVNLAGANMTFSFPRTDFSETPGLTLTVEASTDLITWPAIFTIGATTATASPGVTILENGADADTITVALALDALPCLFARLRVTIAP